MQHFQNPVEAPNAAIEKLVTPKGEKKKSAVKKATPPPPAADKKVASDGPSSESKDKEKEDKVSNSILCSVKCQIDILLL